jgi:L-lactate dehydrogenase complex protein LldG
VAQPISGIGAAAPATAREEVLSRIRTALGAPAGERPPPEQRAYRTSGDLDSDAMLDLLADRLIDYRCSVRRCSPPDLPATVAAALKERGARRVVLPPDLDLPLPDPANVAEASEWVVDDDLPAAALDTFDAVITTATLAIAETGTIVLDGSAGQGRRALTLIPDYHLCVLYAWQVVALVPEAVAALDARRPLTWISGPSATSDIELDRVEGVHGPRTLEVILVRSPAVIQARITG